MASLAVEDRSGDPFLDGIESLASDGLADHFGDDGGIAEKADEVVAAVVEGEGGGLVLTLEGGLDSFLAREDAAIGVDANVLGVEEFVEGGTVTPQDGDAGSGEQRLDLGGARV